MTIFLYLLKKFTKFYKILFGVGLKIMNNPQSKRNYIHRKKTYNMSLTLVRQTLELISLVKKVKMLPQELDHLAKQHTDRIEAVCWDPRTKITDDIYQQLVTKKTRELCNILINKHAPQINTISLLIQMHGKDFVQKMSREENQNQGFKDKSQSVQPLPLPVFKICNTDDNQPNNILLEADKSNNLFSFNEEFQFRPDSPNFLSTFINHDEINDAFNNDFSLNSVQPPDIP